MLFANLLEHTRTDLQLSTDDRLRRLGRMALWYWFDKGLEESDEEEDDDGDDDVCDCFEEGKGEERKIGV